MMGAAPFTRKHVRKSRFTEEAESLKLMAEVVLLCHRQVKPQGRVTIKTNPCECCKMNQVPSRHETLQVNPIDLKGEIPRARGGGIPPMMVPNMPTL